ncbi:hypothetical protein ACFT0G_25285 [Streptomyces sp. NPDC057020]|uniref:hypothetical protein n=1 Tax=unclassified Streptomyces TaxID=2593676 RepID=UPI00362E26D7
MIEVPLFDLMGSLVTAAAVAVDGTPADEEPEAPASEPVPALVPAPMPVFEVIVRGCPPRRAVRGTSGKAG